MARTMFYEMVFEVTETCNNGKERTFKKSVLCEPFKRIDDRFVFRTETERMESALEELKENNFYKIKYLETKKTSLMFA